jgi:hypothetical protein
MPAPQGLVLPMRRALFLGYVAAAVLLPVAGLVGWLVAGTPGLWGAVLGVAVPVVFLSVTGLVALATARMNVAALGATVLGSWVLKLVLLLAFLAVLRGATFYSRPVFFWAFLVSVAGYLMLEAAVVVRTRAPYVEPAGPIRPQAEGPDRL